MAGYIEKKKVNGGIYYYLTETVREGGKWKKKRKYLGVHTPHGFEKPRREPKHLLSPAELRMVDGIRGAYAKGHKVGPSLWKDERDLFISFIFNTNAIEGSTLTLDETRKVLDGKKVSGKKKDAIAARNMKKCIDMIFSRKTDIDEKFILALHKAEMGGILPGAGSYRIVNVRVGKYVCPDHADVPRLMGNFLSWHDSARKSLHPFELAALCHLKFVRIHPFRDGNGRMARLLMNFVLLKNGYPLLNIFDSEKLLYYLTLQQADYRHRSLPFVKYLFRAYALQYKGYLEGAP